MSAERVSWFTLLNEVKDQPPPPIPELPPPTKSVSSTRKPDGKQDKKDKSKDKKEKDKKGKSKKKAELIETKPAAMTISAPVKPTPAYSTVGPSSGSLYTSQKSSPAPSGSLSARAAPSRVTAQSTFAAAPPTSSPYVSQPVAPAPKTAPSPIVASPSAPAASWQQRLPQGALVSPPAAAPPPVQKAPPPAGGQLNRVVEASTQERRSSFSRTASTPTFSQNAPPDAEQVKQQAINVVGALNQNGSRATTSMSVVIRETEQLEAEFAALNRELQSLQSKSPLAESVADMTAQTGGHPSAAAEDGDDWRTYMNSATESVRAILEPQQDEIQLAIATKLEEERRDMAALHARLSQPNLISIPEEESEHQLREDDDDHRRGTFYRPPVDDFSDAGNRGTTVYLTSPVAAQEAGDRGTTVYRYPVVPETPSTVAVPLVSPRAHNTAPFATTTAPSASTVLPLAATGASTGTSSPPISPTSAEIKTASQAVTSTSVSRSPASSPEDPSLLSRNTQPGSPAKSTASSRILNPAHVPSGSTAKVRSAFAPDGRPISGSTSTAGETPNAQDLITNIAKVNVKELAKRTEEREREAAARAEQLRQLEESKKKHAEQNRVLDAQMRKKLQEEKTRAELKKQQTSSAFATPSPAADEEKRSQEELIRKRLSDERRQAESMLQRMLEEERRAAEHIRLLREQEEVARHREEQEQRRQEEFARQERERQRQLKEQQEAEAHKRDQERKQQEQMRLQQQQLLQAQQLSASQATSQAQVSPRALAPSSTPAASSPMYSALMAGASNSRIARFREQWFQLFLDSGVPDTFAKDYALTFAENEIELDQSSELTPEILKELKVKLGHILRIIRFVQKDKGQTA